MMKLKVLFLVICCQALFGQGESKNATNTPHPPTASNEARRAVKVVRVKGDPDVIAALAGRASGVDCQVSGALKAIVLKGPPADVANVERTIRELDNLSPTSTASGVRNIELTMYVIAGSSDPIAGFDEVSGDALAPVLKQVRAIFPYKHYELLTTALVRSAQNSGGGVEGVIKPLQPDENLMPSNYRIAYESVGASTEAVPVIHVGKLQFSAGLQYAGGPKESRHLQSSRIGINSNVDIREGQKVVVGNSSVAEGNTSVFLVVSARLVQ